MRKILPFKKPIVSYEPVINHITGIIASDFEKLQCALYNNFIDITFNKAIDFYDSKNWIKYEIFEQHKIPRRILSEYSDNDIIKIICTWIDQMHYVLIALETYYVEYYPTYQNTYFRHYAMILGYDTEKQKFICGDFFDFQYYSVKECDMDEIINAIKHNGDIEPKGFAKDFTLLRIDKTHSCEIEINRILQSLGMLKIKNNWNATQKYGLEMINFICEFIDYQSLAENEQRFKRHAQFLLVHMEVMQLRIKYFFDKSQNMEFTRIMIKLEELLNRAENYRNYILKLILRKQLEFPKEKKEQWKNQLQNIKTEYQIIIDEVKECLLETSL